MFPQSRRGHSHPGRSVCFPPASPLPTSVPAWDLKDGSPARCTKADFLCRDKPGLPESPLGRSQRSLCIPQRPAQTSALRVVVPVSLHQESVTTHKTYYDLGTKLSWTSRFTSHNRTNMRLIDADDAVFNLMTLPHIQVPLLAAEFLDHQQLPV